MPYLFQWDDFTAEKPAHNAEQKALAVAMGRYWGNFALTGNPNGEGLANWPLHTEQSPLIQLLEPTSMGGIRTSAPSAYQAEHKLGFWSMLGLLKRPQTLAGVALGLFVMVALAWKWLRHKKT